MKESFQNTFADPSVFIEGYGTAFARAWFPCNILYTKFIFMSESVIINNNIIKIQ